MKPITPQWVHIWSARYPIAYDAAYYDPHIGSARRGNVSALEEVTKWKNPGKDGKPMNLSKKKRASFLYFCNNLHRYLGSDGEAAIRKDFHNRAPVWSVFWSHVLFGTPIFDKYTYVAYEYLKNGRTLSRDEARITAPGHWGLFDNYREWFESELRRLQPIDPTITERVLDRALFIFGQHLFRGRQGGGA